MPAAFYQDEWPMAMIRQRLDRSDRHLFTELLAHCTRNLTDGVIDVPLAMITDHEDAQAGVEHLIDAGMLQRTDDKLAIAKDWWKKQRSRKQVETSRQRNAEHQEAYRQRGLLHAAGDHRQCTKGCPDHGKDLRKALTESLSKSALSSPLLSDDKGGEEKETTVEGSTEGALTRASATPSPQIEPHVFAERFTGKCGWCGQGQSNPLHQKASQYLQRASETLRSLGALTFTVTRRGDEHLDLIADIPGYGLKLQYNTDDEQIGWAELDIPGEVINFDAGPIDAALDRIMAAAIPEAEPPSEYEPMDADHLDNVRAHIELVIVDEFSRTRPWQDVLPHLGTFISLAPAFTAATYNPEEVAA